MVSSEHNRYSRQLLFSPIGETGQSKLSSQHVAVVGMGALGSVIASILVRAGVGRLRLIDRDFVEFSNLQRQFLYTESDAMECLPKAMAAKNALLCQNSDVQIEAIVDDFTSDNAESYIDTVDLILDGTDNWSTRYLINDVAVKHGIPWIYGGAVSSTGSVTAIIPGVTPCLACSHGETPPGAYDTCDTVGVIGPIIQIIAGFQAAEALKILSGQEAQIRRGVISVDVWRNQIYTLDLTGPRQGCTCCQGMEFRWLANKTESMTVSMCGRNTVQVRPPKGLAVSLSQVGERLKKIGVVYSNEHLLQFRCDDFSITLFPDGRALVQGVDDAADAKKIYARYIGM